MGAFRYRLEVGDPEGNRFEGVEALVDTGATFTVVPATLLQRLGVEPQEKVRLLLADGRTIERDIAETRVRLEGKTLTTKVVFGDDEIPPRLGVYTLEGALLAVDPVRQRLVPTEALLMVSRPGPDPSRARPFGGYPPQADEWGVQSRPVGIAVHPWVIICGFSE